MTLAMDFGTCNTVLARWNVALGAVEVLRLPRLGRTYAYRGPKAAGTQEASVVPSLIHYGEGDRVLLGAQVTDAGVVDRPGTFRWLKLDMLNGLQQSCRVGAKIVFTRQAAEDFVRSVLAFAVGQGEDRDMVVTAPVEAYDAYMDWLTETVARVFRGQVRMLDEATACILGYQDMVREDEVHMVFDFGGGTLDVSVVKVALGAADGRKCRILGRAGEELGGNLVDRWMLERLRAKGAASDEDLRDLGPRLLVLAEDAKIAISNGAAEADVLQFNDRTGRQLSHVFTRAELAALLEGKEVFRLVARTIDRALDQAQERYGIRKRDVRGVFMVGGTSLLLGVQDAVRALFPDAPVRCDRPFDAIVAGACRYAGEDLNPTLVHEYGMRSWNPKRMEYEWVTLIPRGTAYPTNGTLVARYVSAAARESDALGLVIVERSAMSLPRSEWELAPDGRLRQVSRGAQERTNERELNPQGRRFIRADPPSSADEARRFVVGFGVDRQKRMVVSVKDTRPGNRSCVETAGGEKLPLPVRDYPLVKL